MLTSSEKITELEQLRNAALAGSESYAAKSTDNKRYDIAVQVKAVIDSMPILTQYTAVKLAGRVQDKVQNAILTSIWGKIAAQGELKIDEMIAYAKAQKKDTYYNHSLCSSIEKNVLQYTGSKTQQNAKLLELQYTCFPISKCVRMGASLEPPH